MTGCRIGKVTYKCAPNLSVLTPKPKETNGLGASDIALAHEYLDDLVAKLRDGDEFGVGSVLLVGWDMRGAHVMSFVTHKDQPIVRHLIPAFVAEILRNRLITEQVVVDTLNRGPTG